MSLYKSSNSWNSISNIQSNFCNTHEQRKHTTQKNGASIFHSLVNSFSHPIYVLKDHRECYIVSSTSIVIYTKSQSSELLYPAETIPVTIVIHSPSLMAFECATECSTSYFARWEDVYIFTFTFLVFSTVKKYIHISIILIRSF